jgi:hypothetical protein
MNVDEMAIVQFDLFNWFNWLHGLMERRWGDAKALNRASGFSFSADHPPSLAFLVLRDRFQLKNTHHFRPQADMNITPYIILEFHKSK